VLGANSKEQTKFVHYDIMRDIILNSPPLLNVIGLRNVQEKDIRLKDSKGRIVSTNKSVINRNRYRIKYHGLYVL